MWQENCGSGLSGLGFTLYSLRVAKIQDECYNFLMKKLPLGVQTFRKFIEGNYLYVDKTQYIYNLLTGSGQYFFLSRPRRFGKSVLLSTLAEVFSGNKELFKGLWIYDKIEWKKHPVIYIDFSEITFKTPAILEKALESRIEKIASENGIKIDRQPFLKEKFAQLIEMLSQSRKEQVVILIDEYDKPLTDYIGLEDVDNIKEIKRVLKDFYGVIKAADQHLRFVFITGVSKFSKVSVFSDLNNLTDLSLWDKYSSILGYTGKELKNYFSFYIETMAKKRGESLEKLLETVKSWYNGYSWDGENFVYNPFSIVNLFNTGKFKNFWFSTGTPSFLIHMIEKQQSDIMLFENMPLNSIIFDSYDIENIEIPVLLFQTGYLTIKRITVKDEKETYYLSYPNKEVQDSFLTHLFDAFTGKKMTHRSN